MSYKLNFEWRHDLKSVIAEHCMQRASLSAVEEQLYITQALLELSVGLNM